MNKIDCLALRGQFSQASKILLVTAVVSAFLVLAWGNMNQLRAQVYYAEGRDAWRMRNAPLATTKLITALRFDKNLQDARSVLSEVLIATGQYKTALHQLDILQQRFQASELHLRYGQCYLGLGQKQKAYESFQTYAERFPVNKHNPQLQELIQQVAPK